MKEIIEMLARGENSLDISAMWRQHTFYSQVAEVIQKRD